MTHVTCRSTLAGLALSLVGCLGAPLPVAAGPVQPAHEWSRLASVPSGTAIIVNLADGRHLQRAFVGVTATQLTVADVGRLRSAHRRDLALQLLRENPARFSVSGIVDDDGRRVEIVEHFDRQSILSVTRRPSHSADLGPLSWLAAQAGPCPNCDARQTLPMRTPFQSTSHESAMRYGSTVLPSPLSAVAHSTTGEVLYAAQALDAIALPASLAWPRLHDWLSAPVNSISPEPANTAQKQEQKAGPNVAGKWTVTLDMSMGTATPALDLKQDGEKIGGTYTGRYGTFDLQGTLKNRAIQFAFNMSAEGETVTMSFTGEVAEDGQSMRGTATLGEMGDASWTAKKDKS